MRKYRLKLNESKTEFLVLGTPQNRENAGVDSISVGKSTISRSSSARNETLNLEKHIPQVAKVFIDETLNLEKHIPRLLKCAVFNSENFVKYTNT